MIYAALICNLFINEVQYFENKLHSEKISLRYSINKNQSKRIVELVKKYSYKYNISLKLFLAIIEAESSFNNSAKSKAGAIGIAQIMPSTGKFIAKKLKIKKYDLNDLETNIKFGAWYLSYLQKRFNNEDFVIMAYNCGPNRFIENRQLPKETVTYHIKVKDNRKNYEYN